MKKNIIIIALIVVSLFSSVYAFIQQTSARASQKQAEINLELALNARAEAAQQLQAALKSAEEATKMAEANMVVAMSQQRKAAEERARIDEELKKCKGRK